MMYNMNKNGKTKLTRLEIGALVIIIILSTTVVIPQFCSLSEEAKRAAEKQDLSRIRIAISNYYIDSMLKNRFPLCPKTLDSAKIGYASSENPFFTNVLVNNVITSERWRKLSSTTYEGCSGKKYTYSPGTCYFSD
jgi:type II secretory pathway pseudopilin PulG